MRHSTALGPLLINLLPYDRLLPWIVSRRWDFATLVAREGPSYASSEGLYEWYPLEGSEPDGRRYLVGLGSDDPVLHFQDITSGHRGEAVFDLDDRPWLYLGAVDRRLHLKRAAYGIWRDDRGDIVRYRSVAGGPYVDEWVLEREGAAVEALRDVGGVLILTANDGCGLKSLPSAALFEALPPDSQAAWLDLRRQLADAAPAGSPPDFGAMFDGIAGEPTIVEGCSLDAFARAAEQVSFRLTLAPGFRIDRDTEAAAFLRGLGPGTYVVSLEGAGLIARPLEGPAPLPMEVAVRDRNAAAASAAPPATVAELLAAQGLTAPLPFLLAAVLVLAAGLATIVAVAVIGGGPDGRPEGKPSRPVGRATGRTPR